VPAQAFFAALERGDILLSQATLTELEEVLGRSKFDRYITPDEREGFLQKFLDEGILGEIGEIIRECRDPKDDNCPFAY
jgi:predicted nucleic acid-binding protein